MKFTQQQCDMAIKLLRSLNFNLNDAIQLLTVASTFSLLIESKSKEDKKHE